VRLAEVVLLATGLAILLGVELVLLRRALAPLRRLMEFVASVDPLDPGRRMNAAKPR